MSVEYAELFDEGFDTARRSEIKELLENCADMNDVEALADCDDATISFGEFEAISYVLTSRCGWYYR